MRNSILIADGDEFFRSGLRHVIEARAGEWHVVAEACNVLEAAAAARIVNPTVAIVNIDLTGGGILALTGRLAGSAVQVIGVAETPGDFGSRMSLLRPGTELVSRKDVATELPGTLERIRLRLPNRPRFTALPSQPGWSELTPREIEIANLITAGNTNKEIARRLNLSVRTVEAHRLRIRGKLGKSMTSVTAR